MLGFKNATYNDMKGEISGWARGLDKAVYTNRISEDKLRDKLKYNL